MLSDIALIHNNAKVGSQIACALSKQENGIKIKDKSSHHGKHPEDSESNIVSTKTFNNPKVLLTLYSAHNAVL